MVDEKNPLKDPLLVDNPPNLLRQKAMRECRYIDLLIDCLVNPFVEKLYKIEDLSQKHPITKICKLIYRLLKHCVKDNSMNKNYVAQWINLFFTHAMKTTEQNSFGAEQAIEELITDNVKLLENQIDEDTIRNLVDLCLESQLNQKFLNLLSSVCSCNERAIPSNQDYIYNTILKD